MTEATNSPESRIAELKTDLGARKAAAVQAAEADALQRQMDAVGHYEANLHSLNLKGGLNDSLVDMVAARGNKLTGAQLEKFHELETHVLKNKGHFSALTAEQQAKRMEYLSHPESLDVVKNEFNSVPKNAKFKSGGYTVKGIEGKFIQHTDGSVIHYNGKNATAVMKGAEVETHLAKSLGKAEREVSFLGKSRKLVFGNKFAKGAGKWALVAGAGALTIGGLVYLSRGGKERYDASKHIHDPLPDAGQGALVMGPAGDRDPTYWQNRMRGNQQMAPINPAINAEAQDMGAVR